MTSLTPLAFSKDSSIHQKHPPAKYACLILSALTKFILKKNKTKNTYRDSFCISNNPSKIIRASQSSLIIGFHRTNMY